MQRLPSTGRGMHRARPDMAVAGCYLNDAVSRSCSVAEVRAGNGRKHRHEHPDALESAFYTTAHVLSISFHSDQDQHKNGSSASKIHRGEKAKGKRQRRPQRRRRPKQQRRRRIRVVMKNPIKKEPNKDTSASGTSTASNVNGGNSKSEGPREETREHL